MRKTEDAGKRAHSQTSKTNSSASRKSTFRVSFRHLKNFGFVDESLGGSYILSAKEKTAVGMCRLFIEGAQKNLVLIDQIDSRLDQEGVENFGEMIASRENSFLRAKNNGASILSEGRSSTQMEREMSSFQESQLPTSTVLMICDKASTAIYFDRVLVFKQGKLVEDGHPMTLLSPGKNGKKSAFGELIAKEKCFV